MIMHWTLDAFRKEIHECKRCSARQESKSSVCWQVGDGDGSGCYNCVTLGPGLGSHCLQQQLADSLCGPGQVTSPF